jgi:CDP-ribitol ribitolphosphotransferase
MSWRDRLRLLWAMAAARVIFLDDSFYPVYWVDFPPDVRIIQLWHAAGAFKTVGYSRSASAGRPPFSPFGRVHKNTTHAIVSSDFDAPFYAEALGLPEERLVPTGIPRMDRFFDPVARDAALARARELLPSIAGHGVWLFAPTYRGEKVSTATYDFDQLDLDGLYALAAEQDAVVLFKHHPFITHRIDVPEAYRDRLIEATDVAIDVNDLLFSVDLLITDYSSIVFEYSVLGRPMVFFAYDLDEYIAERDFYVPFAEFVPGPIVRTFPELLDVIRRGDLQQDKVAAFAAKHFAHLDGQSTDRVIDLALGR